MRRLLRVLPLLLLVLACTKSTVSPALRLDFVGSSRFVSSSRTTTSTTPADTLASKLYAVSTGDTTNLRRVHIQVASSPTRTPIVYPTSGIRVPASDDSPLVYLDSVLAAGTKDLAFTNLLSSRTTSGSDLWEYTVSDTQGNATARAYRLALRRTDSATAVLQTYRAYLSPVPYRSPNSTVARTPLTPAQDRAFAYWGLREGLLLPHFSVGTQSVAANRQLIDLVCIANGSDVRLATTTSASVSKSGWSPRNTTVLRATTLTAANFAGLNSNVLLSNAFAAGTNYPAGPAFDAQVTAPLVKNNVIVFRIRTSSDTLRRYGAIFIADIVRTPTAIVTCQVAVQK